MVFQSRATSFKMWVEPERIQKYVNFFGPGVDAEVRYVDRGGDGIQFVARCRACTNIALPQKSAMIRHHRKSVTPYTHIYFEVYIYKSVCLLYTSPSPRD